VNRNDLPDRAAGFAAGSWHPDMMFVVDLPSSPRGVLRLRMESFRVVDREKRLSDVLSEFARTMLTDFPIQSILDHLVERIVDVLPISSAGVTLISTGREPHYIAASDESALRYEQLQSELGEGPCTAAFDSGEAVSIADLDDDDQFPVFGPRARHLGLVAVFTFPLRHGEKRLGALDLYRESAGALDEDTMVAAQTLADVVAAYLLNAQAREDLRESSDLFRMNSLHDALTGLPNRALLRQRLEHASLRARRSHTTMAILFVDLDRFKQVNDIYGHRAGDILLVAVADRLRGLVRAADTVARLSGDEFVVLCEDLDGTDSAMALAQRVVAALAVPFILPTAEVTLTASVGIAFAGPGDHVPDQVLDDADEAMYQAKRAGGDRHQLIDLRERGQSLRHAGLERELRNATERGELRLDYQPIVRTSDTRITAVEALLRWDHPRLGPIPPTTVIPIADQSGLIVDIGRWVLERACADAHRLREVGVHPGLQMCVNVSPRQLLSSDFCETVIEVLAATSTEPAQLVLEMTESVFLQDGERTQVVLTALKQIGVRLALDGFGTGYSSITHLQQLPIDIIKIDRVFTAKLAPNNPSAALVKAVVGLAHSLGKVVVAEGVETADQLDQLVQLGCESSQGFYFGPPASVDVLERQLQLC
jgi:diguanylate cyclase (GGDEF)-like protein